MLFSFPVSSVNDFMATKNRAGSRRRQFLTQLRETGGSCPTSIRGEGSLQGGVAAGADGLEGLDGAPAVAGVQCRQQLVAWR